MRRPTLLSRARHVEAVPGMLMIGRGTVGCATDWYDGGWCPGPIMLSRSIQLYPGLTHEQDVQPRVQTRTIPKSSPCNRRG